MSSVEIAEIKRRAEIICTSVTQSLQADLQALHRRNAAKQMLRSGATVKESATIARASIRSYFEQLEQFVRSRPDARPGFDAAIVDSVSPSTAALIASVNEGLLKTANLAGDPNYVRAIDQEVAGELSASQDTFRSNLRAHWASRTSVGSLTLADRLVLGFEILCFAALLVTIGMWINAPTGSYEPFLALFGIGFTATEIYRRYANRHTP